MNKLTIVFLAMLFAAGCGDSPEKQARDAFLFGYPLVMFEETRNSSPNPPNTIQHLRAFPDHNFRNVVRPNVDTLYSIVWFDLTADAQVLEAPASDDRYYLLAILDAWSNVAASIGSRTTGTRADKFLIAGPDWNGDAPEGMHVYRSPTSKAWMIGRIYSSGGSDLEAAHTFQDGLKVSSLADWREGKMPANLPTQASVPVDVMQKIKDMPAPEFFDQLEALMQENPPAPADKEFIDERWRPLRNNDVAAAALERGKARAYKKLQFINWFLGRKKGWMGMTGSTPIGQYGTDYQARAYIAHVGFGANEPVDAIYPNTTKDSKNKPLHSASQYVLHMAKEDLPPVHAFWSITLYDELGYLTENSIARYALGGRDALTYNEDGSLNIYVQSAPPAEDKMSNWLPAPENAKFALTMRLYWPRQTALNGDWRRPRLKKSIANKQAGNAPHRHPGFNPGSSYQAQHL